LSFYNFLKKWRFLSNACTTFFTFFNEEKFTTTTSNPYCKAYKLPYKPPLVLSQVPKFNPKQEDLKSKITPLNSTLTLHPNLQNLPHPKHTNSKHLKYIPNLFAFTISNTLFNILKTCCRYHWSIHKMKQSKNPLRHTKPMT